jgi:eukaryotic-like serine/threonine-protein kinase
MPLSVEQMARMSALLDQALELDRKGRQRWLEQIAPGEPELAAHLRQALLDGEQLATRPALPPDPDLGAALEPGHRVGPYQLERSLGQGGMAQVWLARRADGAFRREVALKLPMLWRGRPDLAERFARETDILAGLEHPNIARLYDAGLAADGLPYLAMEYVAGQTLTSWCDRQRLPVRERVALFIQVLDAVQFAHGKGVVHRDLKPSNILVGEDGQVRLLDFGVAKLLQRPQDSEATALTEVYGRALTPQYASPELVSGGEVGPATDVYALGVVLYELLSGRRPYELKSGPHEVLERDLADLKIPPPSAAALQDAEAAAVRGTTGAKLTRMLAGDLDAISLKALTLVRTDSVARDPAPAP